MGDITLRAIETLKAADVIFCEDTRMTGKLLERLEIPKKELVRADAEKEVGVVDRASDALESGKNLVYVSDAGTPGISDPGARLVAYVREHLPDVRIEAIPGASSVTAALSIAGLQSDRFTFLGFVPHKKGRETFFNSLSTYDHPVAFFESPHRIVKTLESLATTEVSTVIVARELTKLHEEVIKGSAEEVLAILNENPVRQKGEFVVIVT